jgi:hypothetical protein
MKNADAVFIPTHYELLSGFWTYIMKMAKPFSLGHTMNSFQDFGHTS